MKTRRTLGLDELMIVNPGGARVRTCVVDDRGRVISVEPISTGAARPGGASCGCRHEASRVRSCMTLADVERLVRVGDGHPGWIARRVRRYRRVPRAVAVVIGRVGRGARRR
jgi:hypothetical protein